MSIDDAIREAMQGAQHVPTVTDPRALADQLVTQSQALVNPDASSGGAGAESLAPASSAVPASVAGAKPLVWAAVAAAAVGAIVGSILAVNSSGGDAADVPVVDAVQFGDVPTVPTYACPGGHSSGELTRGDHVIAIAQSPDGDYVQVRNVRGGLEDVYVESQYLIHDDSTDELPVRDCEQAGVVVSQRVIAEEPVEPETPAVEPEQGETDGPAPKPQDPAPEPKPKPKPTTPAPAPDAPPVLSEAGRSPGTIAIDQPGFCLSDSRTSAVSVKVTDDLGVTGVKISYQPSNDAQVVRTMTLSGGKWTATVGDFHPFAIAAAGENVTVSFIATDSGGNTAYTSTSVFVKGSDDCGLV